MEGARSTPVKDAEDADADAEACLCWWCLRAATADANVDDPEAAADDAKPTSGGRSNPPKAREEAPNPEKRSWAMCVGQLPLASMLAWVQRGGWGEGDGHESGLLFSQWA
jgi:hypothetical protein